MFTPSSIAGEIVSIAQVLDTILPGLSATGVPQNTVTQIDAVLQDVEVNAKAFATADNAANGLSLFDRIVTDLNGVLATLATIPLPAQAVLPVRIAGFLLPVIQAAVDMVLGTHAKPLQVRS